MSRAERSQPLDKNALFTQALQEIGALHPDLQGDLILGAEFTSEDGCLGFIIHTGHGDYIVTIKDFPPLKQGEWVIGAHYIREGRVDRYFTAHFTSPITGKVNDPTVQLAELSAGSIPEAPTASLYFDLPVTQFTPVRKDQPEYAVFRLIALTGLASALCGSPEDYRVFETFRDALGQSPQE